MMHVLIIEDDKQLGKTLVEQLKDAQYTVTWVQSVRDFNEKSPEVYDLAIVDLNLPDGSGFDIIRKIQVPVIIMTAQNSPENRLEGVEMGVYDFIPKPFLFKEMLLKVDRLMSQTSQVFDLSTQVKLDLKSRTVEDSNGDLTFLNDREYKILRILIKNSPEVISRDAILDSLDEDESASHRSIDNIIVKLRQILKDEDHKYIHSVRGVGYKWLGDSK